MRRTSTAAAGVLTLTIFGFTSNAIAQHASVAWSAPQSGAPSGIATDAAGNVYVSGSTTPAPSDGLVLKYSPTGSLLWSRTYNWLGGVDRFQDIALDPTTDDLIVVGARLSPPMPTQLSALSVVRYSSAGALLWTPLPSVGNQMTGNVVEVDSAGNIYVEAEYYVTGSNINVFKFAPGGSLLWQAVADDSSGQSQYIYEMSLDPSGNLFLAGGGRRRSQSDEPT